MDNLLPKSMALEAWLHVILLLALVHGRLLARHRIVATSLQIPQPPRADSDKVEKLATPTSDSLRNVAVLPARHQGFYLLGLTMRQ